MDYFDQPTLFLLRKVFRYMRLYGPRRTLAKVRARLHMRRRYKELPIMPTRPRGHRHAGIIGCGNFSYSTVSHYLKKNYGSVILGTMDINIHRAASLCDRYDANYYTSDANRILQDSNIDLYYIASNHASHAEYAIAALKRGASVHIEKPHVVTREQLLALCRAMQTSTGTVHLGFNRPLSPFGRQLRRALRRESGPGMYNWFVAGHRIDTNHWYFKDGEGGRVLGNLCHWTDFLYRLVPSGSRYPIEIVPTRAESSDCDISVSFVFGDGSIGTITFSAKGHTFEGVRERFSAHRGNTLVFLDDFKTLTIEVVERKRRTARLFRDHGHEDSVKRSYEALQGSRGSSISYVWETGELFLTTKRALEENRRIRVYPFSETVLEPMGCELGSTARSART